MDVCCFLNDLTIRCIVYYYKVDEVNIIKNKIMEEEPKVDVPVEETPEVETTPVEEVVSEPTEETPAV